jgi:5-methyltetrahydrofolate--homocysteine methyltransferase
MPDVISGIHEAYLKAGSDIIETCSFNAASVSLADYGLADLSYEISAAAAGLARKAADSYSTPDKPRFVAGSIGPTGKSLSMSPDMNAPEKRAVTWDGLEAAFYENARGLVDGGADIIIIETVFDTLNAKAAIFAVSRLAEERGIDIPVIVSATVLNSGGRILSGQTVEAFCVSVLHANPLAVGLNCSFGAEKLKPSVAAVSAVAPCLVSAYPNAGFPDRMGVYGEGPEAMAGFVEEYFREGLVNIAGGCCGSTPAHIAAIAEKAGKYVPRPLPALPGRTLLAGLDVLEVSPERGLAAIGGQRGAADNAKFLGLIKEKEYDDAADIARETAEAGAAIIDVRMDDPLIDAKAAMTEFLNFALQYPDLARHPFMIGGSDWEAIEAGLKCLQGKGLVNSISLKDGEAEFLRKARLARRYGAAVAVALIDEEGPAVSHERGVKVSARSRKLLTDAGFPPQDMIFDPNAFTVTAAAGGD